MINKQNLWFLTLFSLVLVLGVYYVTMPNELMLAQNDKKKVITKKSKVTKKNSSTLDAMRVSLEEERSNEMTSLQEKLTDEKTSAEEKNNLYEQLKAINAMQGKEETIEKKLKEKFKLDCFVKTDEQSNCEVVCVSSKHDNVLANNIMRAIQEEYDNKLYTSVKFKKK